jgi:hypothetical protein
MYGLKRLLEIEAERKKRREEKQKIKAEKEAQKKAEKRAKRIKRLRHYQNKRYYTKIKKAKDAERKKIGDKYTYCMVLLVKNKQRIKRFGASWWRSDAQKIYNEVLEQNRKEVKFPVKFRTDCKKKRAENKKPTKWEILLVERLTEDEENVTQFRNDDGKFVNVELIDNKKYKVIAKEEWYIEEKFNVYGYHPIKDRKDYSFILKNLFLKKLEKIHDIFRVNVLHNKVFISHSDDFDFITCKNHDEAERLYTAFQTDDAICHNKNVVFFGNIVGKNISEMYDRMQEKTGWDRILCQTTTMV